MALQRKGTNTERICQIFMKSTTSGTWSKILNPLSFRMLHGQQQDHIDNATEEKRNKIQQQTKPLDTLR
jgi:hypothetical protein